MTCWPVVGLAVHRLATVVPLAMLRVERSVDAVFVCNAMFIVTCTVLSLLCRGGSRE